MAIFHYRHMSMFLVVFLLTLTPLANCKSIHSRSIFLEENDTADQFNDDDSDDLYEGNIASSNINTSSPGPGCVNFAGSGNCSTSTIFEDCHCANLLEICITSGVCLGDCRDGWRGLRCHIPCPSGTWGKGCALNCSENCRNKSCALESGFCYCEEGASSHGCTPPPEEFEQLMTKFWLIVCSLSLVTILTMVVCGVTCRRPPLSKKKKVLNLVYKRPSSSIGSGQTSYSSKSGTSSVPSYPQGTPFPASSDVHRMAASRRVGSVHSLQRHSQDQRVRRKFSGSSVTFATSTQSATHVGTSRRPTASDVAKHLAEAMSDYDVKINQTGQVKLVRKRAGHGVKGEGVNKGIQQKILQKAVGTSDVELAAADTSRAKAAGKGHWSNLKSKPLNLIIRQKGNQAQKAQVPAQTQTAQQRTQLLAPDAPRSGTRGGSWSTRTSSHITNSS